jgi:mRNA interferase MazF
MITYNFGDVLLVPFPFTDQTSTKKRPTAVISSDTYNQQKLDLIIIAITSQSNSELRTQNSELPTPEGVGLK